MHKPIKMSSTLLNTLPQLILTIHIKHIGDNIERIGVVLHFILQPREVEPVVEVILVDFAKVLVAARGYEPVPPVRDEFVGVGFGVVVHGGGVGGGVVGGLEGVRGVGRKEMGEGGDTGCGVVVWWVWV